MTASRSLAGLPLPVGIFRTAMQQQKPLNTYAATPRRQRRRAARAHRRAGKQVAPEMLARVAAAHGLRADEGQLALAPTLVEEPFSAWLERQMEGVTQASLRARTQLAAPQLRAFLSGKALPDTDEAERLARAAVRRPQRDGAQHRRRYDPARAPQPQAGA